MTLTAQCDNILEIYIDGGVYYQTTDSGWRTGITVTVPVGSTVIGIKCIDIGGAGAILASLSDGRTTDTVSWKCSGDNEAGWSTCGFDDSHWSQPISFG